MLGLFPESQAILPATGLRSNIHMPPQPPATPGTYCRQPVIHLPNLGLFTINDEPVFGKARWTPLIADLMKEVKPTMVIYDIKRPFPPIDETSR